MIWLVVVVINRPGVAGAVLHTASFPGSHMFNFNHHRTIIYILSCNQGISCELEMFTTVKVQCSGPFPLSSPPPASQPAKQIAELQIQILPLIENLEWLYIWGVVRSSVRHRPSVRRSVGRSVGRGI